MAYLSVTGLDGRYLRGYFIKVVVEPCWVGGFRHGRSFGNNILG